MVVIFRGVSGSGKSYMKDILLGKNELWEKFPDARNRKIPWVPVIEEIWTKHRVHELIRACSTDDYFITPEGAYNFEVDKLSTAHSVCLQRFVEYVRTDTTAQLLIVDNTNCSIAEVAPYISIAMAYKAEMKVITLLADLEHCLARTKHGTPAASLVRQKLALEDSLRNWPSFGWKQDIFLTTHT